MAYFLSSPLTALSLFFFLCRALILIKLLPRGVSLIWLSLRIMLGPIPDISNYTVLGGSGICILNKELSSGNLNRAHQASVETFWHVECSKTWAVLMKLNHCTVNTIGFSLRWNFLEGDSKSGRWVKSLWNTSSSLAPTLPQTS